MHFPNPLYWFLIAAFVVGGCKRTSSDDILFTRNKYTTWEAPDQFERGTGRQNVHWIDDDTVVYLARAETRAEQPQIKLWRLSTGHVRAIGAAAGELCYFRGYFTYTERFDLKWEVVHEGAIEKTTAVTRGWKEMAGQGLERHQFNCRYYHVNDFAPEHSCKLPLLPGHGYLETKGGRCSEETQARLSIARQKDGQQTPRSRDTETRIDRELLARSVRYVDGMGNVVTLPIEATELQAGSRVAYLEWAGKYAIPQHQPKGDYGIEFGKWPTNEYSIYLLSTDGTVEKVVIPWWPDRFWRPTATLVLRSGVAIRIPGLIATRERKIGIILIHGGIVEQVDDGDVQQWAMSPNGCRIAYDLRNNRVQNVAQITTRLRVIDVCSRSS